MRRRILLATRFVLFVISALAVCSEGQPSSEFIVGARLSSYLTKRVWDGVWVNNDPLLELRSGGFEWAMVQLRTKRSDYLSSTPPDRWVQLPWRDEYWCSEEMGLQMLEEAQEAGFRLCAYLNLSDSDTHGGKQAPPDGWAGLSETAMAEAVRQYTSYVAGRFKALDLPVEIISLSGEIEWGILGFSPAFPGTDGRIPLPGGVDVQRDMTYMRNSIWRVEARLLSAAIEGVRSVLPQTKILLYVGTLGLLPNTLPTTEFFQAMVDFGVDFDYAGFSWVYPYPGCPWPFPELSVPDFYVHVRDVLGKIGALGKPVLIAEAGYPSSSAGVPGAPMGGYPFTQEGQSQWCEDFADFCLSEPAIDGFFYFNPDWIPRPYHTEAEYHLDANSMFTSRGTPKTALEAFLDFAREHLRR